MEELKTPIDQENKEIAASNENDLEPVVQEKIDNPIAQDNNPKEILEQEKNSQKDEGMEDIEVSIKEISNVKQMSPSKMVMRRFFRSKLSLVGLIMVCTLIVFAFFGPYIFKLLDKIDFLNIITVWGEVEADETGGATQIVQHRIEYYVNGEVYTSYDVYAVTKDINSYAGISREHWLGTDALGYDIFTRLMYGGRISLAIGFIVVFMEIILGVIMGGISGYFGGWVDQIIMRIVDIFNCIPTLPILLISSATLESLGVRPEYKIYYLMFIITLFGWSGTARLVRGQILFLREQEYMIASEVMGYPTGKKIFGQLIPNVLPQLIVSATLGLGSVILYESTLSYLNLGVQKPYAAWGTMISAANDAINLENYPLLWVPAGICVVLAVLGFNFVGDGLRDAFDPKGKR